MRVHKNANKSCKEKSETRKARRKDRAYASNYCQKIPSVGLGESPRWVHLVNEQWDCTCPKLFNKKMA
jgi:hypothetical protein